MTVPMDPELADRLKAQQVEYGTYRAKSNIYAGTALAYREGDPVPVSNVERWKYAEMGLVVKVGTKAERDAFPDEFTDDATAPSGTTAVETAADADADAATSTTTTRRRSTS